MVDSEPPLARVVGLFALYTFYFTQPSTSDPSLHALKHIDTTIGALTSGCLPSADLTHIQTCTNLFRLFPRPWQIQLYFRYSLTQSLCSQL